MHGRRATLFRTISGERILGSSWSSIRRSQSIGLCTLTEATIVGSASAMPTFTLEIPTISILAKHPTIQSVTFSLELQWNLGSMTFNAIRFLLASMWRFKCDNILGFRLGNSWSLSIKTQVRSRTI